MSLWWASTFGVDVYIIINVVDFDVVVALLFAALAHFFAIDFDFFNPTSISSRDFLFEFITFIDSKWVRIHVVITISSNGNLVAWSNTPFNLDPAAFVASWSVVSVISNGFPENIIVDNTISLVILFG